MIYPLLSEEFEMPKEVFWRPKKSPMRVFVLPDHTCPNTEVWGTQIRYMLMITHTEGRKKYNMDSQGNKETSNNQRQKKLNES